MKTLKASYIASVLANDEVSTDSELIYLFMQQVGINEAQANEILGLRDDFLTRINPAYAKKALLQILKK
ncbi:MAG: hypothetical protein ACOX6V_05060 [Patescibacteria group bacterium]|jgi:hypothetical protein